MPDEFIGVQLIGRGPLKKSLGQAGFHFIVGLAKAFLSADLSSGHSQNTKLFEKVHDIGKVQSVLHKSRPDKIESRRRQIAQNHPQDFDFAERNLVEVLVNLT
ncbi:MAG: hypothetical protein HY298_10665 [Verrucomicrobia bacterium]|nr:hypothetical protein [Verrucomicrobiota bacterium]